jgi:signal transduction histidine kinase
VGIDKEDRDRIFERFYQVTTSPDSAASGLGMGLYIAHQIIMLHKGHLLVESEKGKGSTFSFVLPLV